MVMLNESFTNIAPPRRPRQNGYRDESESNASQGDQESTPTRSNYPLDSIFGNPPGFATGADLPHIYREKGSRSENQAPVGDERNQSVDSSENDPALLVIQEQRELFTPPTRTSRPISPKLDPNAVRILRKHFVEKIITDLRRIAQQAGKPAALDYAVNLFKTMRQVRDQTPSDPFCAVVMALHDALAYKNRWSDYETSQYEQACAILLKFANQELFPEKAEKAVMELEAVGFETTPFEVDFGDEEE